MSPTAQVTVQSDKISFNNSSVGQREDALKDYNENTINDVESLKKGIIKISKNKARAPYTILLVGEIGVGKSSFLELIANVLAGNDIDHYNVDILDHANAQGGSNNQSQTNSARLYELTSQNGTMVRILDTPGLTNTRGIEQDELLGQSIVAQIKKNVDSIMAVLVLANGTVPRGIGLRSALSTLSAIVPNTLDENTAFMFTNIADPLSWNFCHDTLPEEFKNARQFQIDNPVALQRKYLKLKNDPKMVNLRTEMCRDVKAAEQEACEMLVNLFDWLDSLEPTDVVPLHGKSRSTVAKISNRLARWTKKC